MDPKGRLFLFKKRKEGLVKKLQQLTNLTDARAAMIIYDPTLRESFIWPQQKPDEFRRMISIYKSKTAYLSGEEAEEEDEKEEEEKEEEEEEKEEKAEERMTRTNSEAPAKYPTWDNRIDSMNEAQLRDLSAALDTKAQLIRSRIQMMKMKEKHDAETMENKMVHLNIESQSSSSTQEKHDSETMENKSI